MFKVTDNQFIKFILFFSIFALIFAYYIEYILGFKPCNLCLLQRIPYYVIILTCSIYLISKKNKKNLSYLLIMSFLSGTLIAFYHYGIEQGFFQESIVCLSEINQNITTVDEIIKILPVNKISCKEVGFTFFGFSLALLNSIISFLFFLTIIFKLINNEKI